MSRPKSLSNVVSAALTVIFAVTVAARYPAVRPILSDVPLILLLVFSFFFSFWQFLVIVLSSAIMVNWQPGASPELIAFIALPLAAHGLTRVFPSRTLGEAILFVLVSIAVFYAASYGASLSREFTAFLGVLVVDVLWSGALYYLFAALYPENGLRASFGRERP